MNKHFFHNKPKKKTNTFQQLLKVKAENINISKTETSVILKTAAKAGPNSPLNTFTEGYTRGVQETIERYSAVLLLCLKDKFDFTPDQLKEVAVQINETFDCVTEGYLSLNDITQTLKEEDGIEVRFLK